MNKFIEWIEDGDAREEIVRFFRREKTFYGAWHNCERGDHLLWFCAQLKINRDLIVMAGACCAETALIYLPPDEIRPKAAIEIARARCRGEATLEDVKAAVRDAHAAARAASAAHSAAAFAAALAAAYVAASAAFDDDAFDVYNAAEAAYGAASASAYTADATLAEASQEHAEIVRKIIKYEIVEAEMKKRGLFY